MFQNREKSFKCKECDALFLTRGKLHYHNLSVHIRFERKCDKCEKILTNKAQFRNHVYKCQNSKRRKHKCEKCEATYISKYKLASHCKTSHSDLTNKTCEFCDKTFTNVSQYENHVRSSHKLGKRFQCDQCDAAFVQICTVE